MIWGLHNLDVLDRLHNIYLNIKNIRTYWYCVVVHKDSVADKNYSIC